MSHSRGVAAPLSASHLLASAKPSVSSTQNPSPPP